MTLCRFRATILLYLLIKKAVMTIQLPTLPLDTEHVITAAELRQLLVDSIDEEMNDGVNDD